MSENYSKTIPEEPKEFRHRTDIAAFQEIFNTLSNQIKLLSGEMGFNFNREDKRELSLRIRENISNLINVLINISERLHDYKDAEVERTLQEIKDNQKKPVILTPFKDHISNY